MMPKRAHGEGSVFTRVKNGRTVYVAQASGARGKQFSSTKSARDAMRKRDAWLATKGQIGRASADDPVKTYLAAWLAMVSPNLRPRTIQSYRGAIDNHINPTIGTRKLGKVKPQHVEKILADMAELSPASRQKVYDVLNQAMERARKLGLIPSNPVESAERPNVRTTRGNPIVDADLALFVDAIKGDRLEALWWLLLGTGLTRGEALAISHDKLSLWTEEIDGVIVWRGQVIADRLIQRIDGELRIGPVKTASRERTLSLPSVVAEAMRLHIIRQKEEQLRAGAMWGNPHNLVFTTKRGTPLEPRNVYRRFLQIMRGAGVTTHYRLHQTRHTTASMLIRDGADIESVRRYMGHARASITLDIYTGSMGDEGMARAASSQDAALRRIRAKA